MRKILILLINAVFCMCMISICSYANEFDINIQSEVIDIESQPFDSDVTIMLPNIEVNNKGPEVRDVKYIIRDTEVINGDITLGKSIEIEIVEEQDEVTKILLNDNYYFVHSENVGNEEEIEEEVNYPYTDSIPLTEDLQKYIYDKCMENGIKYCLFLGLCQQESSFGTYGTINGKQFHVVSKTADYGMCQTNKRYVWPDVKKVFGWDNIEILFDPYRSVDAGIYEFAKCVAKYGNSEAAYDAYNRGLEHHGSTKNSRAVVRYWNNWKSVLGDI